MGAFEILDADAFLMRSHMLLNHFGQSLPGTERDKQCALGQRSQCLKTVAQLSLPSLQGEIVVRCQRGAVETAHHYCFSLTGGVGHSAEGSLTEQAPKTGIQHTLLQVAIDSHRCLGRPLHLTAVSLYHHGQQLAFLASHHSAHLPVDGGDKTKADVVLVAEQCIACRHPVAFGHQQAGHQPHIVGRLHGIERDVAGIAHATFRHTLYRQIEAFFYFYHIITNLVLYLKLKKKYFRRTGLPPRQNSAK